MRQLDGVQLVAEPAEASFQVCEEHHKRMMELLIEFGVGDKIAKAEEVNALLESGKSDPVLDVSRVLFTLAVNAVGAKDLATLKCPVCAFQKFDFLAKISGLVAIKYREQPRIIAERNTPKLILPS